MVKNPLWVVARYPPLPHTWSFKGVPRLIFSMFVCGCKSSASANSQPSCTRHNDTHTPHYGVESAVSLPGTKKVYLCRQCSSNGCPGRHEAQCITFPHCTLTYLPLPLTPITMSTTIMPPTRRPLAQGGVAILHS